MRFTERTFASIKDLSVAVRGFKSSRIKYLGRDFARIQNITFPSFGNIMEDSLIEHADMTNFSVRFLQVIDSGMPLAFLDHFFINDNPSFIIPAKAITPIGFIFNFCSSAKHITKIITRLQSVFINLITSFSQNAVIKIDIPAEAIIATTAGLKAFNIPCSIPIFLYFKYTFAMIITITQDGRIQPPVATTAPGIPATLIPTKVAALIEIGPGVI